MGSKESELTANLSVIVAGVPEMGGGPAGGGMLSLPESHRGITFCISCHTVIQDPVFPTSHLEYTDNDCANCHTFQEVEE